MSALSSIALAALLCGVAPPSASFASDFEQQRERMVTEQIEARGIENRRVLDAMRKVPRHLFVPEASRRHAYEDRAVPIGLGQTISQPYVVAAMTAALEPRQDDRVLEIGTGSGYQAAVLSLLVDRVWSIEIVPELADRSRKLLAALGYDNVVVITGDGYRGLPAEAPFDRIIVTAAPERVPPPLIEQLAVGGRLVIPVGRGRQELQLLRRTPEGIETRTLFGVLFVPMTGESQKRP